MLQEVSLDNAPVPLFQPLSGQLSSGAKITVNGIVHHRQDGFKINLKSGDDTVFHFNPRFKDHIIIRNSKSGGSWQSEERDGGFPLQHEFSFSIVIEVEDRGYNVQINGQFYTHFAHRLPVHLVDLIEIDGDVDLFRFHILPPPPPTHAGGYPCPPQGYAAGGMYPPYPGQLPPSQFYPPPAGFVPHAAPPPPRQYMPPVYNPTLPYSQTLFNGLQPNSNITIGGVIHSGGGFAVYLKCGADVAFLLNPRFHVPTVVRNSKQNGEWQTEEREDGRFPFAYGLPFNINIQVTNDGYSVLINGAHYCHFAHRIPPFAINELEILDWSDDSNIELTMVHVV